VEIQTSKHIDKTQITILIDTQAIKQMVILALCAMHIFLKAIHLMLNIPSFRSQVYCKPVSQRGDVLGD